MKKYNIGVSLFLIIISIWMFMSASDYNEKVSGTAMGAGEWPAILAVVMIILCGVLLIQTLREKNANGQAPFAFASVGMKRVYILVGILSMFAILLKIVGFYIAVACLVPSVMYLLGERRWKVMFVFAAGILLFVYAVFGVFLGIKLPMGLLE